MERLDDANKCLKTAADFEAKGDLANAKENYIQGANWLSHVLKYSANDRMKPLFREHLANAITNAERVKAQLDSSRPTLPSGSSRKLGAPQPAGTTGVDLELDPLMETLRGSIVSERPNIKWEDVAGLEQAKTVLRDATELPTQFPHLFSHGELKPWKGVLLYGPPGTGKTYLAKAVATNSSPDATFLSISSADLVSKWVGESAKLVKTLFTLARTKAPSVVFVDEIDSLVSDRSGSSGKSESSSQLLAEFLSQMDGCGPATEGIMILAATNIPWNLDRAILSRFQKKIYVPLPQTEHRAEQIRIRLKKDRTRLTDSDINAVAGDSERFSGRDLSSLVQAALAECMQEFKVSKTWRRFRPHPFDESLEFAYEPVWSGDWAIPPNELDGITLDACIQKNVSDVLSDKEMARRTVLPPVQLRHFRRALNRFKPSVSLEDLGQFDTWTETFGTSAYT